MAVIGAAIQNRLLDLAKRQFGPGGDVFVCDTAQRAFDLPLAQVTHLQLPVLLATIERDAPMLVGNEIAGALTRALDQLAAEAEGRLSSRMIGSIAKRLGPAAEPFITTTCARLGLTPGTIARSQLPELARAAGQDAAALFGAELAELVTRAVLDSGTAMPPGLPARIVDVACEYLGPDGEPLIRRLCRERLEVHIEELDLDGIGMLARVVEQHGPALIGALRAAAFLTAARRATISPAEPLRRKILDLATRTVGPAGPEFLEEICLHHGLPFDAVDYEHLMWLAELLRSEAAPLAGKKNADELARGVRGFLVGAR
jgi:hypothetical protein